MGHTVKAAFSGEQAIAELLNETIGFLRPELKHSSLKIHTRFMPGTFHQDSMSAHSCELHRLYY